MAFKSRASAGLELSEFFNNEDDSCGYRLAEVFQRRRGDVQRGNFLFVQSEPQRISLDVQLEKVPEETSEIATQAQESIRYEVHRQTSPSDEKHSERDVSIVKDVAKDKELPAINGQNSCNQLSPTRSIKPSSSRLSIIKKSGGVSPADRLRRYSFKRRTKFANGKRALLQDFEDTIVNSDFAPQMCSTPLSQEPNSNCTETPLKPHSGAENIMPNVAQEGKGSSELGSEAFGCSDVLVNSLITKKGSLPQHVNSTLRRTYTMERGSTPGQVILTPDGPLSKRVTEGDKGNQQNMFRGSRLLKTPDNTPKVPRIAVFSTGNNPCSHPTFTPESNERTHMEQNRQSVMQTTGMYNRNHLSATKQMADMDISLESNQHTRNISLRSNNTYNNSRNTREDARAGNRSQITICFDNQHIPHSPQKYDINKSLSGNRSSAPLDKSKCDGGVHFSRSTHILYASPKRIVGGSTCTQTDDDEVVIPETQDLPAQENNSIVIESQNNQVPFVVIPVHQTYNNSSHDVNRTKINKTEEARTADGDNKSLCRAATIEEPATSKTVQHIQNAETEPVTSDTDNLRLTDIITDDDDDESIPQVIASSVQNNSHVPLDLAGGGENNRVKRLRKRSLHRRQKDVSRIGSAEDETDPLPLSLSTHTGIRKRSLRRKQIPLNKAPGTPLNGEEFAKELARMSNYEILDLRKRNSLGRVFAISGRKSEWTKEQAIRKQIELDDEIELELLRRNMEIAKNDKIENTKEPGPTNIGEEADMCSENLFPPAPDEFCDSKEKSPDNSLLDEQSCDRISFRTRSDASRRQKHKMPDVLRHYLKVSKKYSEKKRKTINRSKRSLYTHGLSDSEETVCNSSNDKNTTTKNKNSLPYVPSPPRSESPHISPLKIVSPPPPLSASIKDTQVSIVDTTVAQIAIPQSPRPPPTQFDTDSGISCSNVMVDQSCPQSQPTTSEHGGKADSEDLFKKPIAPPPKRRGRKKAGEILNNVSSNNESTPSEISSESSTDSVIRRSKRGHVPLKTTAPLFQLLFQQVFNKRTQDRERAKLREKFKSKEERKLAKANRCATKTEQKSCRPQQTMLHTDNLDDQHSHQDPPLKPKKTTKRRAPKVTRKTDKVDTESLECSRIALNTPPPIDHFNNVFDHLRNSTQLEEENANKENNFHPNTFKQKKLKVRVARIKGPYSTKMQQCESEVDAGEDRSVKVNSHYTQTLPENSSAVSSSGDTNQSNFELISWLKNITETDNIARNDEIFKEMRISSASNLCFTELQGVEYAFYDTDDKASLGYLRFKPRQIKPRKRAKRYHLHFVTLVGNFRITANDKESRVGPGDMVAIEKSIYYDIENLSDDIGILMVIKK